MDDNEVCYSNIRGADADIPDNINIFDVDIKSIKRRTKHYKNDEVLSDWATVTIKYRDKLGNKHKITLYS